MAPETGTALLVLVSFVLPGFVALLIGERTHVVPVRNRTPFELLLIAMTIATIFGRATVDGTSEFVFRIDVIDQGEPGTADSYGITISDGYVSGQQQLQGGNVQIHGS